MREFLLPTLIALGGCHQPPVIGSKASHENPGALPDIKTYAERGKLRQLVDDLDNSRRSTAITIAGEGEGSGVYLDANGGESAQAVAAQELIKVTVQGVRYLMDSVESGKRRAKDVPEIIYGFELPFNLHPASYKQANIPPISNFDTIFHTYVPPVESHYQRCDLTKPAWPEALARSAPGTFMYFYCIHQEHVIGGGGDFMDWVVFADFPEGSTERFLLGSTDQMSGELETRDVKSYWFVMAGFSMPRKRESGSEGLTLGLSYSESTSGLPSTTIYGQADVSENPCYQGKPEERVSVDRWGQPHVYSQFTKVCPPLSGAYTVPFALKPTELHEDLTHLSRKMPKKARREGWSTPISGSSVGSVNPSGN